jgi:hypothetical protein
VQQESIGNTEGSADLETAIMKTSVQIKKQLDLPSGWMTGSPIASSGLYRYRQAPPRPARRCPIFMDWIDTTWPTPPGWHGTNIYHDLHFVQNRYRKAQGVYEK